ncbi:hypothetical protein JCM5350_000983 [Sporobolomyces pararoseus]
MDRVRENLPPSPPMTDSSTKSSSPSLLSIVSASAETPPKSPDTVRSPSNQPSPSTSPLPPLPPEVFLSVLRFLPHRDQLRACLVSRSWHTFVVGEPSFWSSAVVSLGDGNLEEFQQVLGRANGNGNKKREGLKKLTIIQRGRHDKRTYLWESAVPLEVARGCLEQVFNLANLAATTISENHYLQDPLTGRYSTLRHLQLEIRPNNFDTIVLLHDFAKLSASQGALLFNLETLYLYAGEPTVYLTDTILFLAPNVRVLSLRFPTIREAPGVRSFARNRWTWTLPDGKHNRRQKPRLDNLEELFIKGAVISEELTLPASLPQLRKLTLNQLTWVGKALFRLLRMVRHTLEHLEVHDLAFDPVRDPLQDWVDNVDIRDPELADNLQPVRGRSGYYDPEFEDPLPILFTRLESIKLTGVTPPIFSDLIYTEIHNELEEYPTPFFLMPQLRLAELDETEVDPEALDDHDPPPLIHLGRHACNLEHLKLTSCNVRDEVVFGCLAAMSARIIFLDFYSTSISDHLISNLPHLTPNLRHLDVRGCRDVTWQGVARLVEVIRQLGDEGQYRVEEVWADSPQYSHYDNRAYRWLDWMGILKRDEEDYEGNGPSDEKSRREWIKEGKMDVEWEHKKSLKEIEEREQFVKQWQAKQFQAGGGSSSSSSSSFRPAGSISRLPPSLDPDSTACSTFAPPPPHSAFRAQSQSHQPVTTFILPKPLSAASQCHSHPTMRYEVPNTMPQVSCSNQAPQPAPLQSQESKLDLTSLDAVNDYNDLDPALVREQQQALAEIERTRNHHQMVREGSHPTLYSGGGGGSGVNFLSEYEAEEAARKRARDERWCPIENDEAEKREAHKRAVESVAGVCNVDSRMAGLSDIRRGGESDRAEGEEYNEDVGWESINDEGSSQIDEDELLDYEETVNETDAVHPNYLG